MNVETHPFETFFESNFKSIVIGTFPCRNFESNEQSEKYGNWYYSASQKNLFWKILAEIYGEPLFEQKEKESILKKNQIGIADIALRIERTKKSCQDSDFKLLESNSELLEIIKQYPKLNLLFTSQNAYKHTIDGFRSKYTGDNISNDYTILLSPSPMANRSIGRSLEYKEYKNASNDRNTISFRIKKYKDHFSPIS